MTEDFKKKPIPKSLLAEKELGRLEKEFDEFDTQVKSLTHDRMNEAPKLETEPQTKLAQSEIDKSKHIYLKPSRSIGSQEKFNEKYREQYIFAKEYVHFIAQHNEIKGEHIEIWTKPFAGMPAEFWQVPTNKPIWAPRYVAEQIKSAMYHTLTMENKITEGNSNYQYYGAIAVESTIQRLDAIPVSTRKSIFLGSNNF